MNNATLKIVSVLAVACLSVGACGGPITAPAATQPPATTAAPIAAPTIAPTAAPNGVFQPAPGGDLVMGLNAEPSSLDPAKALGVQDASVMRQIYDTLVYVDSDYQFHAGLAARWEQSADATAFTFKLKQGITFHDGTPFDAQAVKVNFDRLGDPNVGTGSASVYFTDYKSTEVLDDQTVRVNFNTPKPTFLFGLGTANAGLASPKAIEQWGEDYGRYPVGTGPFRFKEWLPGDRIVLTRNPGYNWAPDIFQHQGPAYLDTITWRFVLEDATRIAMLQSGEASVVEQFPAQDISWLQTDPAYYLVSRTAPGLPTVMELNVEKPPTNELAVRQAMIYATDQESLVAAAFFDTQNPVHSVLAPSTLYYDSTAADMYRYDPEKARAILEQAGWVDANGDGIRERDGKNLEIYYPAYRVWEASYMELLKNMWSAVGFDVKLEQLEDAAAWEAAQKGEHNVTNMGSISFDASVLQPSFHSSNIAAGYAFTRYADPKLDSLLDEALSAIDPAQKADRYVQAQRLIMEQALVVPVYAFERILAVRVEFPNVAVDWENWNPYFYDVYLKK